MARALVIASAEHRRWIVGGLLALAGHATLAATVLPHAPLAASPDAGSPVVLADFAPEVTAAAVHQPELPPGPLQTSPASEEQQRKEAEPLKPLTRLVEPPPPADAIALPKPTEKPEQRKQEATLATPPPSAPPPAKIVAPKPAAPAPGETEGPSSRQLAAWQLKLVLHLERFKRYPREAGRSQGVVNVAFTIDHQGRVTATRVVKSSGSAVLDAEAVALVRRAQPLPSPPPGTPDAQLSQIAPIRYAIAAKR